MRISASLIVLASAALLSVHAQAQSTDKAPAATAPKAQAASKAPATPNRSAAAPVQKLSGDAGKAKIEGVSTMRSTPAAGKKEGGCYSMESDA